MKLGLMSNVFRAYSPEEAAQKIQEAGFTAVQLSLWFKDVQFYRYGSHVDLSGLTSDLCRRVREAFTRRGLELVALGGYTDLVSADEEQRRANVHYLQELMRRMPELGVRVLVTESGRSLDPGAGERLHESFLALLPVAEEVGVIIGLEPSRTQVIKDSITARRLLDELGSERVKVMLDPANILVPDTLETMFNLLGSDTIQGHAKDVLFGPEGKPSYPPAGQGQLDYPRYLRLLREYGVETLVIEYVNETNYLQVRDFLRGVLREVEK
ncbi:MAG TPA: sugar phosphate isomerase/epimerase [Armatimonadetes bacterium]|nr:sugar phosphate isomerase/epimerase [Armatimonadota bacterium]